MIPPKRKTNQDTALFWLLIIILIELLVVAMFSNVSEQIIITILGAIVLAVLGWLGNKARKTLFPSREGLCDLEFLNKDKHGNIVLSHTLRTKHGHDLQKVIVYILSKNTPKTVDSLDISIGYKKSYFSKIKNILVNRYRAKRLTSLPPPRWFDDFRKPVLETQRYQPQINKVLGAYLREDTLNKITPINIAQTTMNDKSCNIQFTEPIEIPIGPPQGNTVQIDLELKTYANWRGVIRVSSNITNVYQYVIKNVEVS